ncbi:MAG TPA: holo-ACP synthase [Gammaproteobacteria bacterium]|nr:holo-ACP synthase [Gammaproteobacteria bacterium]
MIFGVGTDLVEIARIERTYERHGEHFVDRLLTDRERELFEKTKRPVRFLAMHFAAKEAIVKAMGTGFAHGVWIRDIGFYPDAWGKPCVEMSPRALEVCHRLGAGDGFVSLSDEKGLAQAFAILLRADAP